MAQHFCQVCTCGATIAQCRCFDPAKTVTVIMIKDGCHNCRMKALQQAVPVTVEEIEQYPGVNYPRGEFE